MSRCSLGILALTGAVLWLGAGCAKKKRAHLENDEPAPAGSAAVTTALDRFPLDPAVLGSKSYPLKTISTSNLAGRIKEGAASTWPFTLVDARSRVEYENEHIIGSINVPAEKIEVALPVAARERERQVLFYCNGPACTKSHKAGRAAISAGYRDVGIYDEGMPAWKEAGLPVEGNPLPQVELVTLSPTAVRDALRTKSIQLVDIRPRDEFLTFRISGSLNVELDNLEAQLRAEVKPGTAICVVDYTGHQQKVAVRLLARLGYTTGVKGLDGGLRGWQGAGLPVDKGVPSEAAAAASAARANK